jgi:xylan 1,4-beta-xylosidase
VTEYRIDQDHSNAHTIWELLGCPDWPDDEQIAAMREREKLEKAQVDRVVDVTGGVASLDIVLPMHAVSLLLLEE